MYECVKSLHFLLPQSCNQMRENKIYEHQENDAERNDTHCEELRRKEKLKLQKKSHTSPNLNFTALAEYSVCECEGCEFPRMIET